MKCFARILGIAVGAVFLIAGAMKAWNPAQFASDVQNYRLLTWTSVVMVALYLPWLEIVSGAALVFGIARRGSIAICTGLMLVFIGALISAKLRGLDIDCGCFGHTGPHGITWPLLRDALLLAALLFLLFRETRAPR